LAASVALAVLLNASPAPGATDIQGAADDLHLNAQDATIVEILDALSARFKLTYKMRSHNERPLTGMYSGTLLKTLTRVLAGHDYILELTDSGLEITILGASNLASASTQTPPSSQATTARVEVRPASVANPNPSPSGPSPPPLSSYLPAAQ